MQKHKPCSTITPADCSASMQPSRCICVYGMVGRHDAARPTAAVESSSFEKMPFAMAPAGLFGVLPQSIALQGRAGPRRSDAADTLMGAHFALISLIPCKGIAQAAAGEEFAKVICRRRRR